ncbi:MAG: hypothetical protein JWM47_4366 [Acidimicrobiales bacterium]|nr:hypothetical protein [Acidimicrobiales bacterium]
MIPHYTNCTNIYRRTGAIDTYSTRTLTGRHIHPSQIPYAADTSLQCWLHKSPPPGIPPPQLSSPPPPPVCALKTINRPICIPTRIPLSSPCIHHIEPLRRVRRRRMEGGNGHAAVQHHRGNFPRRIREGPDLDYIHQWMDEWMDKERYTEYSKAYGKARQIYTRIQYILSGIPDIHGST